MSFMTNTWKWEILLALGRILLRVQNIVPFYGKMAVPVLCNNR